MNKIVHLDVVLNGLVNDADFINYCDSSAITGDFLMDVYGLSHKSMGWYVVIDESKFTLFLLRHSQSIKKISYE